MGAFEIRVRVANPKTPDEYHNVTMTVDTGATHSALPTSLLERMGIAPDAEYACTFANSSEAEMRPAGEARFTIGERSRTAPVIFMEDGCYLLGATTLQALNLVPDTTNHVLRDAPLIMVGIIARGTPLAQ